MMIQNGRLALDDPFDVRLPPEPYPGLRPFEPDEWPIFFGREVMIGEVIERLLRDRVVLVHGESGCGKSSLVRAGVLVQLQQSHAAGGESWRTSAMLPRGAPLDAMASALAALEGAEPHSERAFAIHDAVSRGRDAPEAIAALMRQGSGDKICILVDQFEEIFRFAHEASPVQAQRFVDVIVSLQRRPVPGLYLVLTMRSDFIGACARFEGLASALNETQYLLPRMRPEAMMRAIQAPARLYGGEVSDPVARRWIGEVHGNQDALPLVQHGLNQLYRRARARGGADGGAPVRWHLDVDELSPGETLATLLSGHAEEVRARVATSDRLARLVEHTFRALTGEVAGGEGIRRPLRYRELRAVTGATDEEQRAILDAFREPGASFLMPYGDAPVSDDTLVDISHEALIRCWRRLVDGRSGWLPTETRDGLQWKSLELAARKFAEDPGQVLSARATEDVAAWLKTLPSRAWTRRYTSEPAADDETRWARVTRLVEASAAVRDEQDRRRRAGFLAFALLSLALGALLWVAVEANEDKREQLAIAQIEKARLRARIAEDLLVTGKVGKAVAVAVAAFPPASADAWPRIATASGAYGPLRPAYASIAGAGEGLADFVGHQDSIRDVAYSPADPTLVATASADRTARLWDTVTGKQVRAFEGHADSVESLAFSPDGRFLLTGAEDGTVRLWEVATGGEVRRFEGHLGAVKDVAFAPDGRRVATASWDGTARVFRFGDGQEVDRIGEANVSDAVYTVAFSPDGTRLAAGSAETARIWTITGGAEPVILSGHTDIVTSVVFSGDGERLATGAWDGSARLWDASTGEELARFEIASAVVASLAFSPDGRRIATGTTDHKARLWQVASGEEIARLEGHTGAVTSVAFSSDGRVLATGARDRAVRQWSVDAAVEGYTLDPRTLVEAAHDYVTSRPEPLLSTADKCRWFLVAEGCPQ